MSLPPLKLVMRLLNSILNILHLLSSQGHHTQGSINQRDNAEDSKAQLQLIHTALKQIHTDSEADRVLKNERDRKRLWIEGLTLAVVTVGVIAALGNLWFFQQQLRANVNVQDIKLLSFEVGKSPEALVLYKNSGLTQANDFIIAPRAFFFVRPKEGSSYPAPPPIDADYLSCASERGSGSILPPGLARTVNTLRVIGLLLGGPLGPLTDKAISDIRSMDTMWYIVVYIRYIDSFGGCHRSVEPFEFDPFTQTFAPVL